MGGKTIRPADKIKTSDISKHRLQELKVDNSSVTGAGETSVSEGDELSFVWPYDESRAVRGFEDIGGIDTDMSGDAESDADVDMTGKKPGAPPAKPVAPTKH